MYFNLDAVGRLRSGWAAVGAASESAMAVNAKRRSSSWQPDASRELFWQHQREKAQRNLSEEWPLQTVLAATKAREKAAAVAPPEESPPPPSVAPPETPASPPASPGLHPCGLERLASSRDHLDALDDPTRCGALHILPPTAPPPPPPRRRRWSLGFCSCRENYVDEIAL